VVEQSSLLGLSNHHSTEGPSDFFVYFLMVVVVMVWGVSWPIGRIVAQSLNPLTAAFFRFTIALPFFFMAAILVEKNIKVERKYHLKLAILGGLQVTLYNFFFLSGLRYTSSSDATLIIAINPSLTAIIASKLYLDEKLTVNRIFGLVIALLGVFVVVSQSPNVDVDNRNLGNLIIFFAALTWATFAAFARPLLKTIKPLTFTAWASFYGWIFLVILSPIDGTWFVDISLKIALSLIYLALAAGVFGNIVFNSSVKAIGPSRAAIFVNLVPMFGIVSSIILLEEKFSYWYLVALFFILMGVYFVNRKKT
jgi:drug/metabolite transporter (DMT)-like permease